MLQWAKKKLQEQGKEGEEKEDDDKREDDEEEKEDDDNGDDDEDEKDEEESDEDEDEEESDKDEDEEDKGADDIKSVCSELLAVLDKPVATHSTSASVDPATCAQNRSERERERESCKESQRDSYRSTCQGRNAGQRCCRGAAPYRFSCRGPIFSGIHAGRVLRGHATGKGKSKQRDREREGEGYRERQVGSYTGPRAKAAPPSGDAAEGGSDVGPVAGASYLQGHRLETCFTDRR